MSSRLYFFDRLHIAQFLSTNWPLPVPEFIVVQQYEKAVDPGVCINLR
jgi:hypothetical protein